MKVRSIFIVSILFIGCLFFIISQDKIDPIEAPAVEVEFDNNELFKEINENEVSNTYSNDIQEKESQEKDSIDHEFDGYSQILNLYTDEELDMLACTIYCEAGADYFSDETRLMVGCVVMNRVEHKMYPDTLYEVLTQKRQYGRFYWTGIIWPKRSKAPEEEHAVQRAYEIAKRVLDGERLLDNEYVYQAEFKQSNDYIYQDGLFFCRYSN